MDKSDLGYDFLCHSLSRLAYRVALAGLEGKSSHLYCIVYLGSGSENSEVDRPRGENPQDS